MDPVVSLALILAKEAIQSKAAQSLLTHLLTTMSNNQFLKSFMSNLEKLSKKAGLESEGALKLAEIGKGVASQQPQNQKQQQSQAQKQQQTQAQKKMMNTLLTLSKQVGHNHLCVYFAHMFLQNLQQLQQEQGHHAHKHPKGEEAKSTIDIEGNDITGLSEEEIEKLANDLGTWMANPKDNPNPMEAYADATREMNEFAKYVELMPENLSEEQVKDVFIKIDQKAEQAAKAVFKMQPEPDVGPTNENETKRRGPLDLPRAGDRPRLNPYDKS